MSFWVLAFFLLAQTVTLWHAEIHSFHEHEELCQTFDNLEKQSVIVDTSSTQIEVIPPLGDYLVIFPCHLVQVSISAYDSRAPPI
ncbi:hypothetical protein [Cocleimonas flava]|uniref:Uncharacterized protein n=1 Tax=Cocleimonas flava TaxID=634765 RepID=A0A4R1F4H2_9GAMM|nr:hypothetical protein [Cocleimonas flava]TCJ87532.1 hypothetical protein EV695_2043 [Cocleimonas flava]